MCFIFTGDCLRDESCGMAMAFPLIPKDFRRPQLMINPTQHRLGFKIPMMPPRNDDLSDDENDDISLSCDNIV